MEFNEFLDKVKVNSVKVVGKAKDTTKRIATVSDIKSKIRGYNNDKNKLFTQMGMDVYIAVKQEENIEDAINEFVSNVDTLNVRIKNLQEKLALLDEEQQN